MLVVWKGDTKGGKCGGNGFTCLCKSASWQAPTPPPTLYSRSYTTKESGDCDHGALDDPEDCLNAAKELGLTYDQATPGKSLHHDGQLQERTGCCGNPQGCIWKPDGMLVVWKGDTKGGKCGGNGFTCLCKSAWWQAPAPPPPAPPAPPPAHAAAAAMIQSAEMNDTVCRDESAAS